MNGPPDDPRWTAYLLGELTPGESAAAEKEMASNPDLRAQVEELRQTLAFLQDALAPGNLPELEPLRREAVLRSRPTPRRIAFLWFPSAAAALLAIVLGFQHYLQKETRPQAFKTDAPLAGEMEITLPTDSRDTFTVGHDLDDSLRESVPADTFAPSGGWSAAPPAPAVAPAFGDTDEGFSARRNAPSAAAAPAAAIATELRRQEAAPARGRSVSIMADEITPQEEPAMGFSAFMSAPEPLPSPSPTPTNRVDRVEAPLLPLTPPSVTDPAGK